MIIEIANAIPCFEQLQFAKPINWTIKEGEHWAVIGPNGAGKTLLTDILLGKYALKSGEVTCKDDAGNILPMPETVKRVAFRDIYSLMDAQNSYYQQRWNKGDEQEAPIVNDLVAHTDPVWLNELTGWFGIEGLMQKEVNLLSSGELRKFLIVKSLLSKPRVLILDNPFIGLDTQSRTTLNDLFRRLAGLERLQVILVLSTPHDIPGIVTDVLPVKDKTLYGRYSREGFSNNRQLATMLFGEVPLREIKEITGEMHNGNPDFEDAIIMKNVHIAYGSRTILEGLDWKVSRGEKWALLGPNGSGKSTLLSLVCGDNPQAYANDITLFDRKRGSGESIWDIKKRIGYISPEMHLYYLKNVRCIDVAASGFSDTIGLYRKCNAGQEELALKWMQLFNVGHLKEVSFLNISSGEQRLVLLARAFVKNPDLLILDEPLHGLDVINKQRVKRIIEDFCTEDKSLVYVTHYESEIPDVVDKRLVLAKI